MKELETLSALYHATCRIGLSDTLGDLLSVAIEQARELVPFDHCALMLYEPESGRLSVREVLGYGDRSDEVRKIVLPRILKLLPQARLGPSISATRLS